MPRNPGTGVYTKPSPDVITGTTIESTVYNTFVGDVETDLNAPRPVSSGGTGATSADGALVNVSGEKATQLVASYDTQVWFPGSFRSAAAAVGAPNATAAFAGIAYLNEALANPPTNQNVVIEARDLTDGMLYVRRKTAGTWGAWDTERSTIGAAPFDALAYNGMQVNGSMEVSQERGTTGITSNGYVCDVYYFINNTTAAVSAGQGGVVTAGFSNIAYTSVTGSPVASPTASNLVCLNAVIEGYRAVRLGWGTANAQPITIAFWCQHWRAGTYSVSVRNSALNRSYTTSYTQNVSGANEYKTVTIPGDTTGTWLYTNGKGVEITFAMASGSANIAPAANIWNAANYYAAPGQVNAIASTSDAMRITGVVVLPGTQAPTAAQSPLIMRPYDQELVTCQRYWRSIQSASGTAFSATTMQLPLAHPNMRAAPTVNQNGIITVTDIYATSPAQSSPSVVISTNSSEKGMYNLGNFSGMTAGRIYFLTTNYITLDARL